MTPSFVKAALVYFYANNCSNYVLLKVSRQTHEEKSNGEFYILSSHCFGFYVIVWFIVIILICVFSSVWHEKAKIEPTIGFLLGNGTKLMTSFI